MVLKLQKSHDPRYTEKLHGGVAHITAFSAIYSSLAIPRNSMVLLMIGTSR